MSDDPWAWAWPQFEIKPRELHQPARCPRCSSPDPFHPELPPMRHLAHDGRGCDVQRADGELCGCGR